MATRYLIAEYQKIGKENDLTNEDKENAIKAQTLINDLQKVYPKGKGT